MGEMCLDDDGIDVLGVEGAGVTDFGARQPPSAEFGLVNGRAWRQSQLNKPGIGWMSVKNHFWSVHGPFSQLRYRRFILVQLSRVSSQHERQPGTV